MFHPLELVLTAPLQRDTAYQVWGHPETAEEIGQLFANFCRGKVASLPWSEDAPAPETGVIFEHLARLNESGFLTINSQPAVNGAPSNDPVHGWGPGSGYVYQKVRKVVCLRKSCKRADVPLRHTWNFSYHRLASPLYWHKSNVILSSRTMQSTSVVI
jgi:hypothetical protein